MTIGPAPMMRMVLMAVRFGIGSSVSRGRLWWRGRWVLVGAGGSGTGCGGPGVVAGRKRDRAGLEGVEEHRREQHLPPRRAAGQAGVMVVARLLRHAEPRPQRPVAPVHQERQESLPLLRRRRSLQRLHVERMPVG